MFTSASVSVGAIADCEAILISAYRNPKAFYASLDVARRKVFMEWIFTGDVELFKQLFFELFSEEVGEGGNVTSTERNYQSNLIAA